MATALTADMANAASRGIEPQGKCRLRCAREEQFAPLAADWERLCGSVPFRSLAWQQTWWEHFRKPGDQLWLVACRTDEGRVVGLAPCYVRRERWGVVARLLADEVGSDYLSLLAEPGWEQQVAESLAAWFVSEPRWTAWELSGIDAADPLMGQFLTELRQRGAAVSSQAVRNTWQLRLPAEWEAYLATLSKPGRRRARGLLKKNIDSGRAKQRVAGSESDVAEGVELLIALHQRRQQSLGRPGSFSDERFMAFQRDVALRLWREGKLRLSWTEIAGRVIGIEYSLLGPGRVYYYQSGLEPEAAAEKPGWLTLAATLRWAVESGYEVFDFLRGDDPYKRAWRAQPRPSLLVWISPPRLTARMAHAAWWLRTSATWSWRRAKQRLKRWRAGHAPGGRGAGADEAGEEAADD